MKITKYGHCCLLIEENGARILTDPGVFTAAEHASLQRIDVVLYTHEHADHFHLESLKEILNSNPHAHIVCNEGVSQILESEGIAYTKVIDGSCECAGVVFEGVSATHAEIHSSLPRVQNTGFFIGSRLWYPGDALHHPGRSPEILALPISGPWMKLSEGIDYALELGPTVAFPVHDWVLSPQGSSTHNRIAGDVLGKNGIELKVLDLGKEYEF